MSDLNNLENFFVESIYGAKTKQGLVQIQWKDLKTQCTILDAKKIAYMILEAAEAAATDQALIGFFEKMNFPMEALAVLLKEMRSMRGQQDPRYFED